MLEWKQNQQSKKWIVISISVICEISVAAGAQTSSKIWIWSACVWVCVPVWEWLKHMIRTPHSLLIKDNKECEGARERLVSAYRSVLCVCMSLLLWLLPCKPSISIYYSLLVLPQFLPSRMVNLQDISLLCFFSHFCRHNCFKFIFTQLMPIHQSSNFKNTKNYSSDSPRGGLAIARNSSRLDDFSMQLSVRLDDWFLIESRRIFMSHRYRITSHKRMRLRCLHAKNQCCWCKYVWHWVCVHCMGMWTQIIYNIHIYIFTPQSV